MKPVVTIVLGYVIGTICGLIGSQASRSRAERYDDDVKVLMRSPATEENRKAIVNKMEDAQTYHIAAAVALSACASIGAFLGAVTGVLLNGTKPRWVEEMESENAGSGHGHRRRPSHRSRPISGPRHQKHGDE